MFLPYANTLYATKVFWHTHQEQITIDVHVIDVHTDFRIVLDNMRWNVSYFINVEHLAIVFLVVFPFSVATSQLCKAVAILMSLLVNRVEPMTLFSIALAVS